MMENKIKHTDISVSVMQQENRGGWAPFETKGVTVTHKPTGLQVSCDTERSQSKNRDLALATLSRQLLELQEFEGSGGPWFEQYAGGGA
jgi:peptide chain release factor 2